MTDKDKLNIILRLTSGYTFVEANDQTFIISTPDDNIINQSLFIYNNTIKKNKYEEILRLDHLFLVLVKNEIIPISYQKDIEELGKSLDESKVDLYSSRHKPLAQIEKIRRQIKLIKDKIKELEYKRHSLDRYTLEHLAETEAERFIFSKIVLNEDYKPANVSSMELDFIIGQYKRNIFNMDLREIARTEPWRSMWNTNGESCFRVIGDQQRLLMIFSKMYSNVYEHPECPKDYIINDDDMLDGWFICKKKEVDRQRSSHEKDKLVQRHSNSNDIFVITHNEEERKDIEEWNNARGKIIKGKTFKNLQEKGISRDRDIPELVLEASNGR